MPAKPRHLGSVRRATIPTTTVATSLPTDDPASDVADTRQTVLANERRRIARELHDDMGQRLVAMKMELALVAADINGGVASARLERVMQQLDDAIASMRRIASGLRASALEQQAIGLAIEALADATLRASGLQVRAQIDVDGDGLDGDHRHALYRIAQEAFTNIVRHAQASAVWVRLGHSAEHIALSIEDDGCGLQCAQSVPGQGSGLRGMRERAAALGGSVLVTARSGGGTCVLVSLPNRRAPTNAAAAAG